MPVWVPKSVGHVLRVRTVAPIEVRMKRVMDEERLSAGQAEHRVHESDREAQARAAEECGTAERELRIRSVRLERQGQNGAAYNAL